ncbi:MAG: T9SS type A sorting domain-containing protein [Bacteroidales bacterium]|nr:T9SS type A sorting domain-containing protein [Bacteroidales bacterium]
MSRFNSVSIKLLLLLVCCTLTSHRLFAQTPIPFSETWESGSFETNGWTVHSANNGFCELVNTANQGYVAEIGFNGSGSLNDTVYFETPLIDARTATKGVLLLDFDFELINPEQGQCPQFKLYIKKGYQWEKVFDFVSDSSIGRRHIHFNLTKGQKNRFRLKFATVRDSDTTTGIWRFDNINIYLPETDTIFQATALTDTTNREVKLEWGEPQIIANNTKFDNETALYYASMVNSLGCFFQYPEYGVGIMVNLTGLPYAKINSLSFFHNSATGVYYGRSKYNVWVVDIPRGVMIAKLGPFLTTVVEDWERNIPLNLIDITGVDSLGVFIEPLTVIQKDFVFPELGIDLTNLNPNTGENTIVCHRDSLNACRFLTHSAERLMEVNYITPSGKEITVRSSPSTYNINRWQQSLPLQYLPMATVDSNTTQWFDTQVERGWYSYFVTANYADGSSLNSDTVAVEMPSGQGLVEPSAGLPNVAPNPVQGGMLRLSDANQAVSIRVTDLLGRTIAETTSQTLLVNGLPLPQINTGCFLAHITLANGQTVCRKFVVQ